ncbi:RING/U-box superfamily protein putative isoform 1 [Tripterygium wilfordii]|uniref:RING/U-box superfamily protein putative isoform 1 n=1 Tax=Tripterygium wilfordii TaxID=458696 RepID=A0A7J7BZ41_TRIWF|nr:uncharacterized protein LOC119991901 [Tripterygium wilfordii]XP_038694366.1 uncharacterized protein LOC119991901 [Tripterygium wilfordii]XP_038694367.1 uncharacterized protein LOC119991901 [Tripterygium wilfordii]XP_038694368.1 uncharacterized protein LOC119991901 [Tripterygium wilfordii]KAF5727169.1 RING/U-box superfamily protein putative isoform 1 [Tripterygium wilfordii]
MDPHEPYWRTNSSFSPLPSRWDFRFQSDDWQDGSQLFGSSSSSNSKESSRWMRSNHLYGHHYSSDVTGLFLSSPSDLSQGPQWTPPAIQEISIDEYEAATRKDMVLQQSRSTPNAEGNSGNPDSAGSTSLHSDSSESESATRTRLPSYQNFSSHHRCFLSKPVHPFSFPNRSPRGASDSTAVWLSEFDTTQHRDSHPCSSTRSSAEFADVSEAFGCEVPGQTFTPSVGFRCGLCERFLSQRSPWGSRRIVRSGDMPVAGVLSCRHVFHAECLEQITPKTHRNDPPCPLCVRMEENSPDQCLFSRLRNSFPKLRPFGEDGQSKPWGCTQVGDCVEGALHAPPPSNTTLFLNRNRIRKSLSLKTNSSKEFPGKLKKNGPYSLQLVGGKSVDQSPLGCSEEAGIIG